MLRVLYMYMCSIGYFFFFKQKTAYEMRISDWSSDVCSSDLVQHHIGARGPDVVDHLGIERGIARRPAALRIAHVDMHDGGAGGGRLDAGVGDLARRHRHLVGAPGGVARAGHGAGDEDLAARLHYHGRPPFLFSQVPGPSPLPQVPGPKSLA